MLRIYIRQKLEVNIGNLTTESIFLIAMLISEKRHESVYQEERKERRNEKKEGKREKRERKERKRKQSGLEYVLYFKGMQMHHFT